MTNAKERREASLFLAWDVPEVAVRLRPAMIAYVCRSRLGKTHLYQRGVLSGGDRCDSRPLLDT